MSEFVSYEQGADIGTVTVRRPDRLNALSTPIYKRLKETFHSLTDEVHIIRLRTAGDRAFVAGADMKEFEELSGRQEFARFLDRARQTHDVIESHPAIVIAEVDGIAYGGGFELALAADMIVAAKSAEFAFPEITNGWLPGGGGTQRLTRIVGLPKAKEIILSGNTISATEAERLGIINRVVEDNQLSQEAQSLADDLLENAPLALQDGKRLLRAGMDASLETGLDFERDVVLKLFETEDAAEGLAAFREGRPPEFSGE